MAGDRSSIVVAFIHPERGITFYSTEVYGFITSWVPWILVNENGRVVVQFEMGPS